MAPHAPFNLTTNSLKCCGPMAAEPSKLRLPPHIKNWGSSVKTMVYVGNLPFMDFRHHGPPPSRRPHCFSSHCAKFQLRAYSCSTTTWCHGGIDTAAGFSASNRSRNNPPKHSNCSWKWWYRGRINTAGIFHSCPILPVPQQPALLWTNGCCRRIQRIKLV